MKQLTRPAITVAAVASLLAGCAGVEDAPESQREPGQEQTSPADAETPPEEPPADAEEELAPEEDEEEAAAGEGQHRIEFDSPYVYESNGVRLAIDAIQFNDVNELESDVTDLLDDSTRTVLVARMQASNDTGKTINFYANQGTIKIGREQVDANVFFSDDFAGGDWFTDTDDDGQVYWELKTPYEEAISAGSLLYTASAPHDSETWDDVAEPVSLTLEWSAP